MESDVQVRLEDLQAALASCPTVRLLQDTDQQAPARALQLQANDERQSLIITQQTREARVQARIPAQVSTAGSVVLHGEALRTWVTSLERTWSARLAWDRLAQQLQEPTDLEQQAPQSLPEQDPPAPERELPPVQIQWPRPPGVWAQLRCGDSRARFPVLQQFSLLQFRRPQGAPWKLDQRACEALRACARVGAGKSLGGDTLMGVLMTRHPDRLVLEATDGRQILRFSFPGPAEVTQPVRVRLWPHWASIWELGLRLDQALQQPTDALGCWADPETGLCWVRSNSWSAVTATMAAPFPDLSQVCWGPDQAQGRWEVPLRVLRAALEEVTAKCNTQVHLRFERDQLLVRAQDAQGQAAQAPVPLVRPASAYPHPVGLLTEVVLGHLATYRGPTVLLGLRGPNLPLAVWDPQGHQQGWLSVIAIPSEVYDGSASSADETVPAG